MCKAKSGVAVYIGDEFKEDGFGNMWVAWCPMCGRKSMCVVRPGKVQCEFCG